MAERKSFTAIGGRVMRVTRLDQCGVPDWGDRSRLVSEGFININAAAQFDETDAVEVRNANGSLRAQRRARRKHNGYEVEVQFVGMQPDAVNIMAGMPLVSQSWNGDIVGVDVDTEVEVSGFGFALEVWSDMSEGDACAPSGGFEIQYVLFPFLQGGVLGDFTIENDGINFTLTGAISKKGHQWGEGPYLITTNDEDDPVTLGVVPGTRALRVVSVSLNPPAETEGAVPLDDPASTPATGATSGAPGAFTPPGSFRPDALADMAGIVASPLTAWTAGQFVMMQSGDSAYWDGDSWNAGVAP